MEGSQNGAARDGFDDGESIVRAFKSQGLEVEAVTPQMFYRLVIEVLTKSFTPRSYTELLFNLMNLGVSLLGVLNTPFWFSLSLIYAIKNWKSAQFFGTAIARVGNLLIATAITMFLFIYLFSIIGFIFLRDRYDMGDGPPACEFFWG